MTIRVAVAGAKGKMGSEVVRMLAADETLTFVCGIDSALSGVDVGEVIGLGTLHAPFYNRLDAALQEQQVDVLVDFTTPQVIRENMQIALDHRVRPVVGTTGLSTDQIAAFDERCRTEKIGALIAPNFAIGAILMMKFAQQAAKYLPDVEIIEMHHDQKLDAPSGTAIKTAEMIAEVRTEKRQGHPQEKEEIEGARGGFYQGFPIHSVRLPGLVAHQQVLFGGQGQSLTIRHDSLHRSSLMPGVNLAIKKVMELEHLIYGLEKIIE